MNCMPITILICARNASATIERAITSIMQEPDCPIFLIDDQSTDDTASRAYAIAGKRLEIIKTPKPGGIALARQVGLDEIQTEFGAWLDADDTWIAGRAKRLMKEMEKGADIVVDNIDLHDGTSRVPIRRLEVPNFIEYEAFPIRLFERNYLPGDSQIAFRKTLFNDAGGYDYRLWGAESFDMLLRVIVRCARFSYINEVGYRMYAYRDSLSRNLARQRAGLRDALAKHNYETIRELCMSSGYIERIAAWILVSMAIYREDYKSALKFLDEACPESTDGDEILESEGPWPIREGWRRSFQRGTILLMMGHQDEKAAEELSRAYRMEMTPEAANNLGVVNYRLGKHHKAIELFVQAKKLFPDYLDAKINLTAEFPTKITSHPLRRQPSRLEY